MEKTKSNKQRYIEMWTWLTKNPAMDEADYCAFLTVRNRGHEYSDCAACDEAASRLSLSIDMRPDANICQFCPVKWTVTNNFCRNENSIYLKWLYADNLDSKARSAREVLENIKRTWHKKELGITYETLASGSILEKYEEPPYGRLTGINVYKAQPVDEWGRVKELRKDKEGLCAGGNRKLPTDNRHIIVKGYGRQTGKFKGVRNGSRKRPAKENQYHF